VSDRLYQLEQRVLMLELALRKNGIETEEFPRPQDDDSCLVPDTVLTPKQLRAAGHPYCPKCFTFGSSHRRDCPNVDTGMSKHVKMESA